MYCIWNYEFVILSYFLSAPPSYAEVMRRLSEFPQPYAGQQLTGENKISDNKNTNTEANVKSYNQPWIESIAIGTEMAF